MNKLPITSKDYKHFLQTLKERIAAAQIKAALAVNSELVRLYWHIGREILERQKTEGWGAKIVEQLSKDLRSEFPAMKGFSSRNLKYMRRFAETWNDEKFVQQAAAQISRLHNCIKLKRLKNANSTFAKRLKTAGAAIFCCGKSEANYSSDRANP